MSMELIDRRKAISHITACDGKSAQIEALENMPTVKAIPKDQYETRLKADMVAMLTEIQMEIEEREQYYKDKFLEPSNAVHEAAMSGRMFGCGECKELIQQKIDNLKEVSE